MSFNRTMYDPKASVTNYKQTRGPGDYMLTVGTHVVPDESTCSPLSPLNSKKNDHDVNLYSVTELNRANTVADRSVIESKLQNRNIPLNKSNIQNNIWDKGIDTKIDKPCNFSDFIDAAKEKKIEKVKENFANHKHKHDDIYNNSLVKHSGCSIYQNSLFTHPKSLYREETTLVNHVVPYLHVDKQKAVADDAKSFREGKESMFYRFGTNTAQLTKDTFDMLKYTIPKDSVKFKENFMGGSIKRSGDYSPHEHPYIDSVYREGSFRNGVCDRACENGNKNGTFKHGKKACKKYCQHRSYPENSCMHKSRKECTKISEDKLNETDRLSEDSVLDSEKHPIYELSREDKRKPRCRK